MDPTGLVKKLISVEEKCVICLEVCIVEDWIKSTRYLALLERQRDHAIFVYNTSRIPCLNSSDLSLEKIIPIERDLKCTAAPERYEFPGTSNKAEAADFQVLIKSARGNLLLELPKGSQADRFLSELQKSRDLLLKSNGLPASFSWIDKYKNPGIKNTANPFATDVFNPFQPPPNPATLTSPSSINDLLGLHVGLDVGEDNSPYPANMTNTYLPSFTPDLYCNKPHKKKGGGMKVVDDYFGEKLQENKLRSAVSKDSLDSWAPSGTEEKVSPVPQFPKHVDNDTVKLVVARETDGKRYMSERESEYVDIETVRVFCGTWNVNGQAPVESLAPWIAKGERPPDIYAVGFQELDLSKEAFIFAESNREHDWKRFVEESLHINQKYKRVKLIRLVGILLIVYVKKDLVQHVTLVDGEHVPTGIMGIMGNKGGVAIRFTIHNTSFCFINSHLAAHQDEFERRNQDYCDINSKMRFKTFVPPLSISEHDVIFWIGDLNYRLTEIDIESVKTLIAKKEYEKLLLHDQLLVQMKKGTNIFRGYSEHKIQFRPTYKYNPGGDEWDSSEKSRIPAWCDRILSKGEGITSLSYSSHDQLKVSDHKPVSCTFDVQVKVVDPVRYKKVYEDVMKKLDREENDILPQVKLDTTEFHFADVKFMEPQVQILTIANIGRSSVTFRFINKLDDDRYSKSFITVEPFQSVIKSGLSCEVEIKVFVTKSEAAKLNAGEDTLDDILVLSLEGGKDIFVPVAGTYHPSVFGSSLEALIQMQGPISTVPVAQLIDLETPGSLQKYDVTDSPPIPIPKELWRLIDHLYQYGMCQNDLFRMSGLHSEVQKIRECLDTGTPKQIPGSIHSVAEAMLIFLQSLPEPVIPCQFYDQFLDLSRNFIECKELLGQIPEHHRNVLKYLCAFLRELLKQSANNGLSREFLASLFGGIFLRPPGSNIETSPNSSIRSRDVKKRTEFVTLFLSNEYDD